MKNYKLSSKPFVFPFKERVLPQSNSDLFDTFYLFEKLLQKVKGHCTKIKGDWYFNLGNEIGLLIGKTKYVLILKTQNGNIRLYNKEFELIEEKNIFSSLLSIVDYYRFGFLDDLLEEALLFFGFEKLQKPQDKQSYLEIQEKDTSFIYLPLIRDKKRNNEFVLFRLKLD